MKMNKYKIRVNLVSGKQLTYTIEDYKAIDNGWIEFYDKVTNSVKRFDGRNCQIEVLE